MSEATHLTTTRTAYNTVAADYEKLLRHELDSKFLDRAILAGFAEYVLTCPVLDIGCGPGRVTAHLRALGVDSSGIDLSPSMIAVAKERHPNIQFDVGSMLALALPDASLAGVLAWYSIIHLPPTLLPEAFEEFARVLRPGGELLLACQSGNEARHIADAYGHQIDLGVFRLPPEEICTLLEAVGFTIRATTLRAPEDYEKTPQAFIFATKR
ncbi:class I SAM-dependent methyltransferase [Renibacterium salmoninarum]|uniref:class I SAM-dependent methyltransferase n=1 Tax=Renibacterium salmoninarum TaxID=1646 RepID=UPI000DF859C0|nr:class I SAM-dependent methyltransferase [Renibacterium salmoninarum]